MRLESVYSYEIEVPKLKKRRVVETIGGGMRGGGALGHRAPVD